jgi:hypothetical protein
MRSCAAPPWALACPVSLDSCPTGNSRPGSVGSGRSHRAGLKALAAAQMDDTHFHDLRHTGNDLAASTDADLRTLMDRMGHSTTRAALIYQHRRADRQHTLAPALSKLAEDELSRAATVTKAATRKPSGTQRARGTDLPLGRRSRDHAREPRYRC